MGTDGDAVLPVKWESPSSGGTETDYTPGEVNPWEDVLAARGIYPQRPSPDSTIRKTVKLSQDGADRMTFEDAENTTPLTLTDLATGGGGLTPATHRVLDQLVHDVAEDYYLENTWSGARLTNMTYWTDATKTVRVREHQYTYTGSRVTQEVIIQYDGSGVAVETLTITNTWSGGKLASQTAVLT